MPPRFAFGPERQLAQRLPELAASGHAASFTEEDLWRAASWQEFLAALPAGIDPDFLAIDVSYHSLPSWIWGVPVPLVGLAGDAPCLWHGYRTLAGCDMILADTTSVEHFHRQGLSQARVANLYGVEQVFLDEGSRESERDIDILFVGSLQRAMQRQRLSWLGRIAALAQRWRVRIVSEAWGADYRALLRRAKIVFNRSARSEWNRRSSEALSAGALLFSERGNREVPHQLRDRCECVFYDDGDLESLLEYYLGHGNERDSIARAGHARAREFSFEAQWRKTLDMIEADWPALQERSRSRAVLDAVPALLARVHRAATAMQALDAALVADLQAAIAAHPAEAALHNALGAAVCLSARHGGGYPPAALLEAMGHFRAALQHDGSHLVAALNLCEVQRALGDDKAAAESARRILMALDRDKDGSPSWLDAARFPPGFDLFGVEWEQAAWRLPGDPAAEARAKRELLRWRLHALSADLTGELCHYHEAALARPNLGHPRAALGCALARGKRQALAIGHLRLAVEENPFDAEAARALYQALTDMKDAEGARRLAQAQGLLAEAAPWNVEPEPWHIRPVRAGKLNLQVLSSKELEKRYGKLDTSRAVHSFTPPEDAHVVLTLLAHCRPQRIVEIGTAEGHMTANLTEWSPDDATIYSLGITRDMQGAARPEQEYEAPPPEVLGRAAGHFGKGDKVCLVKADSARYDFRRLGEVGFAFIDGAHDKAHVLSDTRNLYAALQPGGCIVWHDFGSATPWVEVNAALEEAALPEPILHVAGTHVAFLFKGAGDRGQEAGDSRQGVNGATSAPSSSSLIPNPQPLTPAVLWEGAFGSVTSLALVNRELCLRLPGQGFDLSILPCEPHPSLGVPELSLPDPLTRAFRRRLDKGADVHVRHKWPPDFRPPRQGRFVVMQPWEFGSIPASWLGPIVELVDDVWVPTRHVRDSFVSCGVPEERVAVLPHGVDVATFHPEATPLPLSTVKRWKFLFVGGTIPRKGIDILLEAYGKAFRAEDDVCLVIKDMGNGSFYRGQTGEDRIAAFRGEKGNPEVEYIARSLGVSELAGLYAACDCLVQPYRGEGFCLPLAEAMACGRPVVVTGMGAALDFCSEATCWLIPAKRVDYADRRLGDLELVHRAWLAEPDIEALVALMRQVAASPDEARRRGQAACAHVREHLTWDRAAALVADRLRVLMQRPVVRFQRKAASPRPAPPPAIAQQPARRQTVSLTMIVRNEEKNLAACLACIYDLVDEIIIVDTGSTDRTREIALSFGPKVKLHDFTWIDDFAAARNESLRHATGDWILWLDADDRIDEPNRERLRQLLASLKDDNAAYNFKCVCPPDASGAAPTVVDHIQLFRNRPGLRWRYPIHEQILSPLREAGAEIRWADVEVIHTGYLDPVLRAKKTQRDLRILRRAHAANPNEPFTLFNLGMTLLDLGQHEEALGHLRKSLERSQASDSIVRKLHSLIASCLLGLGRRERAVEALEEGLKVCPDDGELLFRQAQLLESVGSVARAEACLRTLISSKPEPHFASTDPSIRAWRGRHQLAGLLLRQRRFDEARALWRELVAEQHGCFPAWIGLADLAIEQGDPVALEEVAAQVARFGGGGPLQADLLRARLHHRVGDYVQARELAERMIAQVPDQIGPRVILARALAGGDSRVAEDAWRQVLLRDPSHEEANGVLGELLRQRVRTENAYFEAKGDVMGWVLGERYLAACTTPSELHEHLPRLHEIARDCKRITDVGTGRGLAALAFLWAQPQLLVLVDVLKTAEVEQLESLRGQTQLAFRKGDILSMELEETDLLFLDTRHDGGQLKAELDRHAGKARRYIVLHGTAQYAEQGETPEQAGIGPVVEEFLKQGTFRLAERNGGCGGLVVLERIPA